jgi:succinyl-CoA synthetase alpha subunit
VSGVPVFDTCDEAAAVTGATMSVSFVGGHSSLDAVCEAANAGIRSVICMEEFVPVWDTMYMRAVCQSKGCALIGPNCNGLMSPGKGKVGFFPRELGNQGPVGVISRSGTLAYGAMLALDNANIGQSTTIGIGGNAIKGLSFVDCLELFAADGQTEAIVLLGEIGGSDEQRAASYVALGYRMPVVALMAGRSAPPGVAMGHAGAISQGSGDSWLAKAESLREAGIDVANDLDDLARIVGNYLH